MSEWLKNNKYTVKPSPIDIGKFIVYNKNKNPIGEIHSGQRVTQGQNAGKIYQVHYQPYKNGKTDPNYHLFFKD